MVLQLSHMIDSGPSLQKAEMYRYGCKPRRFLGRMWILGRIVFEMTRIDIATTQRSQSDAVDQEQFSS
jgi:hypothetical protein